MWKSRGLNKSRGSAWKSHGNPGNPVDGNKSQGRAWKSRENPGNPMDGKQIPRMCVEIPRKPWRSRGWKTNPREGRRNLVETVEIPSMEHNSWLFLLLPAFVLANPGFVFIILGFVLTSSELFFNASFFPENAAEYVFSQGQENDKSDTKHKSQEL